jgi:hypothetical protein
MLIKNFLLCVDFFEFKFDLLNFVRHERPEVLLLRHDESWIERKSGDSILRGKIRVYESGHASFSHGLVVREKRVENIHTRSALSVVTMNLGLRE